MIFKIGVSARLGKIGNEGVMITNKLQQAKTLGSWSGINLPFNGNQLKRIWLSFGQAGIQAELIQQLFLKDMSVQARARDVSAICDLVVRERPMRTGGMFE